MIAIAETLLQAVFVMLIAPFAIGLVRFFKARLQGRRGASPFLPYYSLATFFKKEMVIPDAASWIFRAVPIMVFASSVALVFIAPLLFRQGALSGMSDFLLFAGILLSGSIFLVLGGLDPGGAFGGMGSSREMTLAALGEPAIIMIFSALSFVSGTFKIDGMMDGRLILSHPYLWFSIIALALVALAENARYPVDNPATHLELTMVHEAMILEYSGTYLALLEYASAIKLTVFSLLISNFIFPSTISGIANFGAVSAVVSVIYGLVKIVIAMGVLALVESAMAKMRFYRMQEYLSIAFFTALFGMIIALMSSFAKIALEYHTFFAMLSVAFAIFLFGHARSRAMLRYYALSSFSIGGVAFGLSFILPNEKKHLIIFAVATIAVKFLIVPFVIRAAQFKYKDVPDPRSFLRPASSYLLAVLTLAATYVVVRHTPVFGAVEFPGLLYVAMALVVLGLAAMIVHRSIFSQIIGLLVIENGIAVFTLATVKSLPLIIELGVFVITVASAVILSILSARIRELHGSADTEGLRSLTE